VGPDVGRAERHVTGRVTLGASVSMWFGCVLRGDLEPISIGERPTSGPARSFTSTAGSRVGGAPRHDRTPRGDPRLHDRRRLRSSAWAPCCCPEVGGGGALVPPAPSSRGFEVPPGAVRAGVPR
jgi:hypothetical protein